MPILPWMQSPERQLTLVFVLLFAESRSVPARAEVFSRRLRVSATRREVVTSSENSIRRFPFFGEVESLRR